MVKKIRILFVAEAVSLAHVARPWVLATSLDCERYEVHFAQHPRYRALFGGAPFVEHTIESIEPEQFNSALATGKPLYDEQTLRAYVAADLALIEEVDPDVVVGDFRISLAVSARVAKVPYVTISNAYWSPYIVQKYPVPDLPFVDVVGPVVAQRVFNLVRPVAFFMHTRPLNRVCKLYGMAGLLGGDLGEVYTNADQTLYADVPSLFTTKLLPPNHHFMGPVFWAPATPVPAWWGQIPAGKTIVYVTMGSSGNSELLPAIIRVLAAMDVTAIVSTAGARLPDNPYKTIFMSEFLPGDLAASVASLVICNGGSPTTHQALASGKPVLGIAGNLDQYLNMNGVQQAGAGLLLRSGRLNESELRGAVMQLLEEDQYTAAAAVIAGDFDEYPATQHFQRVLDAMAAV